MGGEARGYSPESEMSKIAGEEVLEESKAATDLQKVLDSLGIKKGEELKAGPRSVHESLNNPVGEDLPPNFRIAAVRNAGLTEEEAHEAYKEYRKLIDAKRNAEKEEKARGDLEKIAASLGIKIGEETPGASFRRAGADLGLPILDTKAAFDLNKKLAAENAAK